MYTKILFKILIILSVSVQAGLSKQGASGMLEGEVVHAETGEKIPGASVYIRELGKGTSADEEGRFAISSVPRGRYELEVRSVGFITTTITVQYPEDGFILLNLKPAVIQEKDVIITSSPLGRNIQYQPAQALNREELQQKTAPSLGEILDGNPGVAMRSFGSAPARPVIRGLDGDRVLVLQNGERMGDMSATAADHAVALDPLAIDRVEVVRGPASLLYGSSALGGVVNLFSYDMPQDWSTGAGGSATTHLATVNKLGAGMGRGYYNTEHFAFSGRASYRSGGNIETPEGTLPGTFLNSYSFGGGAGYQAEPFQTGLAINNMDYSYGLPDGIDNPGEEVEIQLRRFNIQSLTTYELSGFLELAELRLQYSEYGHDEVETLEQDDGLKEQTVDLAFGQKSASGSLMLRHRPAGPAKGAIGVSAFTSDISVKGADALSPDARNYFIAGYIFEEAAVGNGISLQAGGRLEYRNMTVLPNEIFNNTEEFSNRADVVFSGALGLNYSRDEVWEAGFQFARAFRTPTLEELYSDAAHVGAGAYEIGDPDLSNEISTGIDAFLNYNNGRIKTQFSVYVNSISNFVKYAPTGETHTPSGLPVFMYQPADAVLAGFEFLSEAAFSPSLKGAVEIDYVRGRERSGNRDNLPFMTPFRTRLSLMYDRELWWAGGRLRYVNRQNLVAPMEDQTDGYILLGVDGGIRLQNGISLSLRMDNSLDRRYRDHLSRVEDRNNPMPGRNLNVMLTWDF